MVNLKTKADKHKLDNEKRRQSLKEKEKVKLNQSQIIKQALLNTSLNGSFNKKIVFDDEDDETVSRNIENKKVNKEKNCILFDDSDSEEEIPTIKEKIQFSGKKGFELLNLQSTYGNDERFKIDEKFLDDEKEDSAMENEKEDSAVDDNDNTPVKDETDPTREKKTMLNILEGVLGDSFSVQESTKIKKRQFDMIRYDASKKEHEIYEIKSDLKATNSSKKKKLRKLTEGDVVEQFKPEVSKEKFYKVSREIKNSFKENEEEGHFSLLQTYGGNDVEDENEREGDEDEEDEVVHEEKMERKKEKEGKQKVETKEEKRTAVAEGIWKETFFFEENDPRFKDSFEFINKKNSIEAREAAENYDQNRKMLKEILRLHMKKQLQKKDPFRKKIGGGTKNQLPNSRQRNKIMASKKKATKMSSGRKV